MAWTYVALATCGRDGEQPADELAAAGAGSRDRPRGAVQTDVVGQVGIITLGDRDKRNAIGAEMASQVIGNEPDYARFESGYDPADALDQAIMATRAAVFPEHGMMPLP